jgi:hypothetical protein
MSASVHEAILAQVQAALLGANIAQQRVFRGRVDALAPDEIPAINIRRGAGLHNSFSDRTQHQFMEFTLDCHVRGVEWETIADDLHMQAHQVLTASPQLALLCKGLRCIRTEMSAEPGDETIGALSATYQAQALVQINDLTKAARG